MQAQKLRGLTWRRTSARSMSFSCTSLSFSCTSIDFSVISKFDSFILGRSQHLLGLYSLRSLILRLDFTISRKKQNRLYSKPSLKPVESGLSTGRALQSTAPASQKSWVRIPFKPEFFATASLRSNCEDLSSIWLMTILAPLKRDFQSLFYSSAQTPPRANLARVTFWGGYYRDC